MNNIEEIKARNDVARMWLEKLSNHISATAHKELTNSANDIPYLLSQLEALQAENARLREERDKAVSDIKIVGDKDCEGICCEVCKYYTTPCPQQEKCFEWRGITNPT